MTSAPAGNETSDGVFHAVSAGYDAVYTALPGSDTFSQLWRSNAYRDEFPAEFAHIGFLTLSEAQRLLALLAPGHDDVIVDVACGTGGPGLWVAQQSRACLIGVDPSPAGLAAARERAARTGLEAVSRFEQGSFERTGLPASSANVVMSIEAFQYSPDKRAGLTEARGQAQQHHQHRSPEPGREPHSRSDAHEKRAAPELTTLSRCSINGLAIALPAAATD